MNTASSSTTPADSTFSPDKEWQQFEEDGFILLRQVIQPSQVDDARNALKELVTIEAEKLLEAGKINDLLEEEPFETRLLRLYEKNLSEVPKSFRHVLHREGLFNYFFNASLLDRVERFLGPEVRLYPNYTCRPKFPDLAEHRVLWHQDGGYTESHQSDSSSGRIDELRMINVWSPLVPARVENGCMQFIPGTHRLGVVSHEQKAHYLQIAEEHLVDSPSRAINIEMDPGDVVLFNNLLFHQGLPNRSQSIRWTLDWRYQDATQPTLRRLDGHIARSKTSGLAVRDPKTWASIRQEPF